MTDPQALINRVAKNQRHLAKWARREGLEAYRLYDRDIPEIPLVLDWYDGRLHIAHRAARATRDVAETELMTWLEALTSSAAEALGVDQDPLLLDICRRCREGFHVDRPIFGFRMGGF